MRRTLIFIGICLLARTVEAQVPSDSALSHQIDALAQKTLKLPVAGVSVAIAHDGRVVFAKGYGLANVEHSVPVRPETVFHIDSISKNILAAVILRLVEQGKLSLSDDVTKYVPEAPTHGRHVTVRQLLDQTSGIYSFTSLPNADDNERLDLNRNQVLALIKDKPPLFEPGTSWRYDNSAFYIAGMVVESATKREYAEYVRDEVFGPLDMSSARLCDAQTIVPNLASGHERSDGKLVHAALMSWKLPFAAGAVCMTASDLVRWETALDEGRFISKGSVDAMRSPTILSDGTKIDYGLGTRLGSLDGHPVVGHTGGGGGFNSVLYALPRDHVAIAVLINTGTGAATTISFASAIARFMLGIPEPRLPNDVAVPNEELDNLATGGRLDSDDGPVETFIVDGRLHFRIPGTKIEGPMTRLAPYRYAVDEDTEVQMQMRNGKVTWGLVYLGGMMTDAKTHVP